MRHFDNKLVERVAGQNDGPFVYNTYKALGVVKTEKGGDMNRALYRLEDPETKHQVFAVVPIFDEPFPISDKGEIMLKGVSEHDIHIREIERIKPDQLTVFEETTDVEQMYHETLKSAGVSHVDIAVLGGSGDLVGILGNEPFNVKPSITIALPQFNGIIFDLKAEKSATLFACQLSPDFFGDRSGKLATVLKDLGAKHMIFTGTAGGLGRKHRVGDIVVPEFLLNFAEGEMAKKGIRNQGLSFIHEHFEDDRPDNLVDGSGHVGVHSPITESEAMISQLQESGIESVDCEAGFIADALNDSDVSLYHYFFISDLPGTDHFIGMGGLSAKKDKVDAPIATKELVLGTIKHLIGKDITDNQKKANDQEYTISGNSIKTKSGFIRIDILLPDVATQGGTVSGILSMFSEQVSELLEASNGLIDVQMQQEIQQLVQQIYKANRVEISVEFDLFK